MTKFKSQEDARNEAAAEESAKKRAARQAAKVEVAQDTPPNVTVRVLKKGAEKISMGIHVAGIGEAHYDHGETFEVALPIAEALEERGFVEVVPAGV